MWKYNNIEFKESNILDAQGYVYLITNKISGKKYIGKKNFTFKKTKQVKGKKKRIDVASDWQTYYGSNEELNNDVKQYGEINFDREILRICKTKAEMTYYETYFIFMYDALLKPNEYYNSWIMARVRRDHLKKLHI